jgi:hypothetical protein
MSSDDIRKHQRSLVEMAFDKRESALHKLSYGAIALAVAVASYRNPSLVDSAESAKYIASHHHTVDELAGLFTAVSGSVGGFFVAFGVVELNTASGLNQGAAAIEGSLATYELQTTASLPESSAPTDGDQIG